MARTLEFFFDLTSPYSYLASTQVEALAQRTGAELRYRPFLIGAVFQATNNTSPLWVETKRAHMLKDLRDWTRHYGLPEFTVPAAFPFRSLEANRLALVALEAGKGPALVNGMYRAAFAQGRDLTDLEVLKEIVAGAGLEPAAALARISAPEIKAALKKNGDEAIERGAFGAPTFFVGDEMFVGNDRLMFVEKALRNG